MATFNRRGGLFLGDKKYFRIQKGSTITKMDVHKGSVPVVAGGQKAAYYHNEPNRRDPVITISASGRYAGFVNYFEEPIWASDCNTIQLTTPQNINLKYVYLVLKSVQDEIYKLQMGNTNGHVYDENLETIEIYVPAKVEQDRVVKELWDKGGKGIRCEDIQELLTVKN